MTSQNVRLQNLESEIASLKAQLLSQQEKAQIFSALGTFVKYGCKVTEGADNTDMVVKLEGQASGDSSYLNPDVAASPTRFFQYANIGGTKGGAFYSNDTTATVETAPAAGTARYDIAYIFAGRDGAGFQIAEGTPSAAVLTDFGANGLQTQEYATASPNYDPTLPVGAVPVARIYVAPEVTAITDSVIADLRSFQAPTALQTAISNAEEWANKAEDSLVSAGAGGDQVDDYSALHHAEKAKEYGEAWASTAEDTLVATAAGGDGANDYSAKHHANKASASATTAETHKDTAINNAAAAAASAASISDYSAIVQAISTNYNLNSIQCVDAYMGQDSNGWELRTNLSYNRETVPTGLYLGQYASVTAAVNDGGNIEDWFYNTADTYFYKITATGTPAASRIYRAGSSHLPLQRAAVVSGTGASTRLVIFDLTQDGCPMWMEFVVGSSYLLNNSVSTTGVVISSVELTTNKLLIGRNSTGSSLTVVDFSAGSSQLYTSAGVYSTGKDFSQRNSAQNNMLLNSAATHQLPNDSINALATYTAHDAPLDSVTGMPVPIIKGNTDGGNFEILEDGTVINSTDTAVMDGGVILNGRNYAWNSGDSPDELIDFGAANNLSDNYTAVTTWTNATTPALSAAAFTGVWNAGDAIAIAHADGLDLLRPNPNTPANSLIAKIGTNFNTGWYIDGTGSAVILCDTDTGSVADTELVTNGDFSSGDLTSWGDISTGAGSAVYNSGAVDISGTNAGNRGILRSDAITTVAGQVYKLALEVTSYTSGDIVAGAADSSTFTTPNLVVQNVSAVDTYTMYFQATSTTTYLYAYTSTAGIASVDNFSVVQIAADRSGNDNHFNINGTLTRTAIETGGIAAWSGFSAANYLSSDDADLDIDAVAYTIKGAFNTGGAMAAIGTIFSTGVDSAGQLRELYLSASGIPTFDISGDTGAAAGEYDDGNWHTFSLRSNAAGTSIRLDIDGERVLTDTGLTISAFTFADFEVGRSIGGDQPFPGSIAMIVPEVGVDESDQAIAQWHHDTMRILESGTVTLANTITDAYYDARNGDTVLLDSDNQEKRLNGLVITDTRDLDNGDAYDVGTVAAGASDGRARVSGGSTALLLEVDAKNMREEHPRRQYEFFDLKYEGDAAETTFPSATDDIEAVEGCYPVAVSDAGDVLFEGSSDDYTVEFDGFNYSVELAVAPGSGNDVKITWRREVWK